MNKKQVHKFVQGYLEATDCKIVEKSPAHFIVKLSPDADRALTNRPYYWSFVERTGVEPETMTFLFVTDPEGYEALGAQAAEPAPAPIPETPPAPAGSMESAAEAVLTRVYGHIRPGALNTVRMPRDDVYFGSRRLEQLFEAVKAGGRYVCLYEARRDLPQGPMESTVYTPWLCVNMKVELQCDRKREEIHSFGVSLATGVLLENFHERLVPLRLTPALPANVHVARPGITANRAMTLIETALERKLKRGDYRWAEEASARLEEEIEQIRHYYEPLLAASEEENREAVWAQFKGREAEIRWQYQPRVSVTTINGGIFHLSGLT